MSDSDTRPVEDRAKQLIIDLQHAIDTNSPISLPMMLELKDIVELGISAQAKADAEHVIAQKVAEKARAVAEHLKAEGDDLASANQIATPQA